MRLSRLLRVERVTGGPTVPSTARSTFAGASGARAASLEGSTASYQSSNDRSSSSSSTTGGGSGSSQKAHSSATSDTAGTKGGPKKRRWSFALEDSPQNIRNFFDIDKGYTTRVCVVLGTLGFVGYAMYQLFVYRQRDLPLAKRWGWLSPTVPITLIERREIEGTRMHIFRFALPTPADYAGYEPVSSVRLHTGVVRDMNSLSRWFTPISHPMERGIIEFAIKDQDPGRMASRLQFLKSGDVVYLGRWMKEFKYTPNKYKELGIICSVGGSSVALQLMSVMGANENDKTRLSLLYCAQSTAVLPFEDMFLAFSKKHPDTFRVALNVLTKNGRKREVANGEIPIHLGLLDHTTIMKAMPPPPVPDPATGVTPDAASTKILVCGPVSLMAPVAGRPAPIGNLTYYQGPFYKFGGVLKELGFQRSQVYKFGVSTHVLAHHY